MDKNYAKIHHIMKKTPFNHINLTTNQYCDTFWVQSEWIVHNLQFRTKFCDIYEKSVL